MLPQKEKKLKKTVNNEHEESLNTGQLNKMDLRKKLLPALCLPNEDPDAKVYSKNCFINWYLLQLKETFDHENIYGKDVNFIHPDKFENGFISKETENVLKDPIVADDLDASAMMKDLELLLCDAKQ